MAREPHLPHGARIHRDGQQQFAHPRSPPLTTLVDQLCPSSETGGLFRIAIKLMMAASPEKPPRCGPSLTLPFVSLTRHRRNYVPLANLVGIIFQIRDDYMNLQSVQASLYPPLPFLPPLAPSLASSLTPPPVHHQQRLLRRFLRRQILLPHRPLHPRRHDQPRDPQSVPLSSPLNPANPLQTSSANDPPPPSLKRTPSRTWIRRRTRSSTRGTCWRN